MLEKYHSHHTLLGMSKNNVSVWYDATSSHAATHLRDTPGLTELVIEITQGLTLTDNYYQLHTDMGRVVGPSDLVPTESSDEIVYAKRLNRDTYTVFNKSKSPQPSSLVTTAYQRHNDNTYELISAWIGPSDSPSLPGTERETPGSKEFWTKHALAWGTQDIQPDSLTTRCPW
ncbi:hypothetical protein KDA06_02490 [Candidatus Saccharibacteria bacterium]|nr:hypothetical protein [Candidatus Saccharibacteria bacterium]